MSERMSRPPSVWIAQVLLVLFILLLSSMILIPFLTFHVSLAEIITKARAVFFILAVIGALAASMAAFWGLAKRKLYGKWLAAASLLLFWGLIVYTQLFPTPGPYRRYEYNNAAELAGAFFALSLIHALFLTVILRLAFAKKVNRFFEGVSGESTGGIAPTAV
jgi:peptidoglycan/LPS O-acetylase OafA/YrhL